MGESSETEVSGEESGFRSPDRDRRGGDDIVVDFAAGREESRSDGASLVTDIIVLELSVDAKGAVADSRPLTEVPLLTQAAVDHSKRWRFHPMERRRGIIVYEFALDKRDCKGDDQTDVWRVTADYWRLSACEPVINI